MLHSTGTLAELRNSDLGSSVALATASGSNTGTGHFPLETADAGALALLSLASLSPYNQLSASAPCSPRVLPASPHNQLMMSPLSYVTHNPFTFPHPMNPSPLTDLKPRDLPSQGENAQVTKTKGGWGSRRGSAPATMDSYSSDDANSNDLDDVTSKLGLQKEELAKLSTRTINSIAAQQKLSAKQLNELKSQRRREKNREAAQACRKKKKMMVDEMEGQVDGLQRLNETVKEERDALRETVKQLRQQLQQQEQISAQLQEELQSLRQQLAK